MLVFQFLSTFLRRIHGKLRRPNAPGAASRSKAPATVVVEAASDVHSRDVFVSYRRADETWVRGFIGWLKSAGFSVWWDREDYFGALDRRQIEEQAIGRCATYVYVASKSSTDSDLSGGYWGELRSAINRSRDLNRQFIFVVHRDSELEVPALPMGDGGNLRDVPRFEMWRKPRKGTRDWARHEQECNKLIKALANEVRRARNSQQIRATKPFIPIDAWHQIGEWLLAQIRRPFVLRQCAATLLGVVAALLVMFGAGNLFAMLRVDAGWLPHIAVSLATVPCVYAIWMAPAKVPLLVPRSTSGKQSGRKPKQRPSRVEPGKTVEPVPRRGIIVSGVFAVGLASLGATYGAQGLWQRVWPDPRQFSKEYEWLWWFSGTLSLVLICALLFFLLGVSRRNGPGWMSATGKAVQAVVSVVFAAFCWLTLMPPEHSAIVMQVDRLLQSRTSAVKWNELQGTSVGFTSRAAVDDRRDAQNGQFGTMRVDHPDEPTSMDEYLNSPDTIVKVSEYHQSIVPGIALDRLTFPLFVRFCVLPVVAAVSCFLGAVCRGSDDRE